MTTFGLGINRKSGTIAYYTRHPITVCGTEEAAKVLEKCGATIKSLTETGSTLVAEQLLLEATGSAESLHAGWRIALNPKQEWQAIAGETSTIADLYKSYIVDLVPCILEPQGNEKESRKIGHA